MKSYTLKNIPDEFWEKVKIATNRRGVTIKYLILAYLQKEIDMYEKERKGKWK